MTKCNECKEEMTIFTNSSKAGGCCLNCEEKELHKAYITAAISTKEFQHLNYKLKLLPGGKNDEMQ